MTRYIILGAGAVGGGIGGSLTRAGCDTVLLARGEHLAALRRQGLRLRTPDEDLVVPVTAVGGPAELTLTTDDVLVLATKTPQAQAVLAEWADLPVRADGSVVGTAGEQVPVLTALNGVASEALALRYYRRVYGVCVWMPTVHLVPGEVLIRSTPTAGVFHISRVPAAATDDSDRTLLAALQADWVRAGLDTQLPPDVMPWKYRKLLTNIGNAFSALVGQNGRIGELVRAAEQEAREVLAAAGIAYTGDEEEAAARAGSFTVRPVAGEPAELGGSSWQSLTRGTGSIETDYLNGEIALVARLHGREAPINARVAGLARQAAASGQRPGEMSATRLRELLGLDR